MTFTKQFKCDLLDALSTMDVPEASWDNLMRTDRLDFIMEVIRDMAGITRDDENNSLETFRAVLNLAIEFERYPI